MTNPVYIAIVTGLQTIDTFDLPVEKTISYKIHEIGANNSAVSSVVVSHNGNTALETQTSVSLLNTRPLTFTSSVANNVGLLQADITSVPSTFTIERAAIVANLYSEHTLSGYKIAGPEGVGIYNDNMTVRQSNNNYFGYANTFLIGNTIGPIDTLANLYSANLFESFRGSRLDISNTEIVITSSGQSRNCHYLPISVIGNQQYRLVADVYFTYDPVIAKGSNENAPGAPRITIGTGIAQAEYANKDFTTNLQTIEIVFTPDTDTTVVYVSVGFGALGTACNLSNISIRRRVPFHTFDQTQGTAYFDWNAVPTNTSLASFESSLGNNTIRIDSSNNIFVNTSNIGPQQSSNRLAVTYSAISNTALALNSVVVYPAAITFNSKVLLMSLSSSIINFTYAPAILTTNELIGLTRG